MVRALWLIAGLCLAAPAAPGQVKFEMHVFTHSKASWKTVEAWATAKQAVLRLPPEPKGEQVTAARKTRRTERTLARRLGREFHARCHVQNALMEVRRADTRRYLYQPGVGEACMLFVRKYRTVTIYSRSALRLSARAIPLQAFRFTPMPKIKPRELFGLRCEAYRISGKIDGLVWVAKPAGPLANLNSFYDEAVAAFGGFPGDLLMHVVKQLGGVPVLARVHKLRGFTPWGGSPNHMSVMSYHAFAGTKRYDQRDSDIPGSWQVKRLGFRR